MAVLAYATIRMRRDRYKYNLEKLSSIEVGATALASPMTLSYDLDLQSPASYGHGLQHSHAKAQGQRSVGLKDRDLAYPNGQMDGGDCITSLTNSR